MLDKLIEKIAEQQKGKENTAAYMVGEQLKDICRKIPEAAEIVLRDLELRKCLLKRRRRKYMDMPINKKETETVYAFLRTLLRIS